MKSCVTAILLFICIGCVPAIAQKVPQYTYCEIIPSQQLLNAKFTVEIDSGQSLKLFSYNRIKDKDSQPMQFNSMMDALNYLVKQGWEFVQVYSLTNDKTSVPHFLLRRIKEECERNVVSH